MPLRCPRVASEPVAHGVIVRLPSQHEEALDALARESASILRALRGETQVVEKVPEEADFVLLIIEDVFEPAHLDLPALEDRAGAALAVAANEANGRAAAMSARKHLRAQGAALGARLLVLPPTAFGHLGLESDNLRERLEVLLHTFVHDAERLRLKREGWEEPLD